MTAVQREQYGIRDKLPTSIDEVLFALENTWVLEKWMGAEITKKYAIMKRAEQEKLGAMSAEERRDWLLERY